MRVILETYPEVFYTTLYVDVHGHGGFVSRVSCSCQNISGTEALGIHSMCRPLSMFLFLTSSGFDNQLKASKTRRHMAHLFAKYLPLDA